MNDIFGLFPLCGRFKIDFHTKLHLKLVDFTIVIMVRVRETIPSQLYISNQATGEAGGSQLKNTISSQYLGFSDQKYHPWSVFRDISSRLFSPGQYLRISAQEYSPLVNTSAVSAQLKLDSCFDLNLKHLVVIVTHLTLFPR